LLKSASGRIASLNGLLSDIVQARISEDTNFSFGGKAGTAQGRKVGEMVDALPFMNLYQFHLNRFQNTGQTLQGVAFVGL